jgi:DNA-directed RNA polymerase
LQNRNWVHWKHSGKSEEVDKPWEFLAACFELDAAYSLPDPTKFVSSLPCHQDGTCNGLQYYAALGRDINGGMSVNLCDNDRPQDVYSEVLNVVYQRLDQDPDERELKEFFARFPTLLSRKSVKTTVRFLPFPRPPLCNSLASEVGMVLTP